MTDCNKIRYRPVTGEVQPQQVYKCMTVVYSDYMLSYLMVTCWAVEFPRGRRRLQDEPRPGQSELFYFTGIFKKNSQVCYKLYIDKGDGYIEKNMCMLVHLSFV